jgi:hypothetical protein
VSDTSTTTQKSDKPKKKRLPPLKYAGMLLNSRAMVNIRAQIELASLAPNKVEHPNPTSLAASIADNPHLVDAFDPDFENLADSQLSLETIRNFAVAVFDIVHAESIDIGLISY